MSARRTVPDIAIASVQEEDLPAVLAIEASSFSAPWTEEMFRWELEQAGAGCAWVARRGGRVVGYLFTWVVAGEFHINNIAVAPEYRGQGIADALIKTGLGEAVAGGARVALLEDTVCPLEALLRKITRPTVFIGDGLARFGEVLRRRLKEKALFLPPGSGGASPAVVAARGRARLLRGEAEDVDRLVPRYLRLAEAELTLKARRGSRP